MAENENKKSMSQSAIDAAGSIKNAAKLFVDVGRIFAGDMSAIKDVLANKLVWEILLVAALFISLTGMIIGSSVTGVIEYIANSWEENWDENWTDQAIESDGNLTRLKTVGWVLTLTSTAEDVWNDSLKAAFGSLASSGIAEGVGTSDNSQIQMPDVQAVGRNPNASDYEKTMQAIMQENALSSALTDRLEMIKGRVKQRGLQLKNSVYDQYVNGQKNSMNELANTLSRDIERRYWSGGTLYLYAGYNEALTDENFHFDTSVFDLTDLQALKILAIFSIQHDCQLTDMDMWSLMDYCGWYDSSSEGELYDIPDTIYEVAIQDQRYGNDIGSVTQAGMGIPVATFEFPALQVPIWTGTCAPQWYYEELSQIRKHNEQYIKLWENGKDMSGEILWGIETPAGSPNTYYTLDGSKVTGDYEVTLYGKKVMYKHSYLLCNSNGAILRTIENCQGGKPLTFANLEPNTSYKIYQKVKIQTMGNDGNPEGAEKETSKLLVSFTTNSGVNIEAVKQAEIDISQFELLRKTEPFGIIDRLFYSAENNLTVMRNDYSSTERYSKEEIRELGLNVSSIWQKYVWGKTSTNWWTGSTVWRSDSGYHGFTYGGDLPMDSVTTVTDPDTGETTETIYTYSLSLYNKYYQYLVEELDNNSYSLVFHFLNGSTRYTLEENEYKTVRVYNADGELLSEEQSVSSSHLEDFTTFENKINALAFELYLKVDLSFKARTVDEIAFDLLGIWPGNLNDTTQVVRETAQKNLVGVAYNGQYSYCLSGGTFELIHATGSIPLAPGTKMELKRATSTKSETLPLTTTRTTYEYGITNSGGLSKVTDTPMDGWKTVDADGDNLVFAITGSMNYKVYARVTKTMDVLKNGQTTSSTEQYLYLIDEISIKTDKPVENGDVYAADHLGNKNMKRTWLELYRDSSMTPHVLEFTRMTGYQYESYVDMVMALCELLKIPYEDWDPAVQRANELGLKR